MTNVRQTFIQNSKKTDNSIPTGPLKYNKYILGLSAIERLCNYFEVKSLCKKMIKNPNEERDNPCLTEQKLTYKCLSDNDYKKEYCAVPITNYNTCKGFWQSVRSERRRKRIKPELPDVAERKRIKAEYFAKYPPP